MILDSTCSTKKIWPKEADIRLDKEITVKPDICASATHLPFRDKVFDEIYCDPPHLIRNDLKNWTSKRAKDLLRFGSFRNRAAWLSFLVKTNEEFYRVLKHCGGLHYKITDGEDKRVTKLIDLAYMTNFILLSDKSFPSKAPFSNNTTHYVYLVKVAP